MNETTENNKTNLIKAIAISVAVGFLYAGVFAKLGNDWWSDENYSHGLLVPFVVGLIVWQNLSRLKTAANTPAIVSGGLTILAALILLIGGTLGAELFATRISLVLMFAGLVIYLFGRRVLALLAVPFLLLLLAIPIPQIVFNRIAFPLQMWASQMAVWGIRVLDVPTLRNGNVIDILPRGSTQTISLEVVAACSGIRSLMTLVTLALILGYFTRRHENGNFFAGLERSDLMRVVVLMILAVPIAVLTNAARVSAAGVMTFYYGKQAIEGAWHEASGWLAYGFAIGMLISANALLKRFLVGDDINDPSENLSTSKFRFGPVIPLVVLLVVGGIAVNWFETRPEASFERQTLTGLSRSLGDWRQRGDEIKFDEQTESVLRTTDYTMREYTRSDGRVGNIYVGYYASQRAGATYHSPQNCLPGAGWVMKEPEIIDIPLPSGKSFKANRYVIQNGIYTEVMIYWYQGRGRVEASEYTDKINTVWDSISRSRSDGAIVRVMTSVGGDKESGIAAAVDLSSRLAETLPPFVPE